MHLPAPLKVDTMEGGSSLYQNPSRPEPQTRRNQKITRPAQDTHVPDCFLREVVKEWGATSKTQALVSPQVLSRSS